jgi:hypothetical protein
MVIRFFITTISQSDASARCRRTVLPFFDRGEVYGIDMAGSPE